MVKSSKSIKFTESVSYALLPKQTLEVGAVVSIAGWGHTVGPASPTSRELLYYNASIVDTEKCREDLQGEIVVNEGEMCAFSRKDQGTCGGDSGGPLLDAETRSVLYGVVSRGVKCATGVPDVFVNVYAYVDWINSIAH